MKPAVSWRGALALLALAFALGWFLTPATAPDAALVRASTTPWSVPDLPRRGHPASVAVQVASAPFWGAAAAPVAATVVPDTRWRISATYRVGNERGAVISFVAPDRPPRQVKVGDTLPSGHRITAVENASVCVQIDGKSYRLGVERNE